MGYGVRSELGLGMGMGMDLRAAVPQGPCGPGSGERLLGSSSL
jgi:hypothetical protein